MEIKSIGHRILMVNNMSEKEFNDVRVSQRAEGKCPHCHREVSIPISPGFLDWEVHYKDLEKEYKKLQLEYYKEKGYYDKNKEIKKLLINLEHVRNFDIDNFVKLLKNLRKMN